jgi:transposase-like protein
VKSSTRPRAWLPAGSAFEGFRFPPEVIVLAVRWYLRFNLSYRDIEELLVERGVEVDHVTVYRWVQRFTNGTGWCLGLVPRMPGTAGCG